MPIIIIALAVAAALIIYQIRIKRQTNIVILSSERIKDLTFLNESTKFHKIKKDYHIHKHYDNKSSFTKIEPSFIMSAYLRDNVEYFSKYISLMKENRDIYTTYQESINIIKQTDYTIDYNSLKISQTAYKKIESNLFKSKILNPTIDCTFYVSMSYSSPKGKVNLTKDDIFDFDDLFASFESISRERLDRKTYEALSAFERGQVSDSLRYDILNRDDFKCTICGASSREGVRLHVDHIIPIAKGGKSTPDNLRTLCERCNIGKSDKMESSVQMNNSYEGDYNCTAICPVCSGQMVLRQGKYGNFYGCSNFPKCKYTKNI